MNKFISFLKRRGVQMMPFLITSLSVVVAYAIAVLRLIEKYCDHDCRGNIWEPVFFFTTSFLLGSLALLFVRRRVIAFWALFFLPYIYQSYFLAGNVPSRCLVLGLASFIQQYLASDSLRSPSSGRSFTH